MGLAEVVQVGLLVRHSVASHAWGCSAQDVVERCFGGHDEEVAEDCAAVCSGSRPGQSSEGGTEEGYSGLSEVAAVFGCSAGVRFVLHLAWVISCSLTSAGWNSEMLQHVVVVRSGQEVRDSELFAADCSVHAEGSWVE